MKIKNLFLPVCLLLVFSSSCKLDIKSDSSSESTEEQIDEGVESIKDAFDKIGEKMKDAAEGKEDVELINWREIKEQFPNKLLGMKQENIGGETMGAFGFNLSKVEATYEDGDSKIEVNVTDVGSMGPALMGIASWSTLTIDKEDKYGYERTGSYKGYKTYEKYNKKTERGEFAAIVEDRFVVAVNGKGIDSDDFEKVIDKLDVDDLVK